jgi:hypothetical protein
MILRTKLRERINRIFTIYEELKCIVRLNLSHYYDWQSKEHRYEHYCEDLVAPLWQYILVALK